jgi:hypothetical protein
MFFLLLKYRKCLFSPFIAPLLTRPSPSDNGTLSKRESRNILLIESIFQKSTPENVNSMQDAEEQLGAELFKLISQYSKVRGSKLALNWAGNHFFSEFVLYDRAGEIFAQRQREQMLATVDKFYDNQLKRHVIELFERDIPPHSTSTNTEHAEGAIIAAEEQPDSPLPLSTNAQVEDGIATENQGKKVVLFNLK